MICKASLRLVYSEGFHIGFKNRSYVHRISPGVTVVPFGGRSTRNYVKSRVLCSVVEKNAESLAIVLCLPLPSPLPCQHSYAIAPAPPATRRAGTNVRLGELCLVGRARRV